MFRDARPFGAFGRYSGGLHRWPMPNTVAGALRTRIGFAKEENYFDKGNPRRDKNVADILKVRLNWMLPVWRTGGGQWKYCFPRPADAIVYRDDESELKVERFSLGRLSGGSATDLHWQDWLYPFTNIRNKPALDVPNLWHATVMRQWWEECRVPQITGDGDLGLPMPPLEIRMHVGIDPDTYTAADERLFASGGVRMEASEDGVFHQYGIACSLDEGDVDITGDLHLGGERRIASAQLLQMAPPDLVCLSESAHFLRLQLLTPGSFGGWAPQWLLPEERDGELPWGVPWKPFPCALKLRSAFMGAWQPVSGWDYAKHEPKAMRKMVPAGAVYVVELKDPSKAKEVGEALWLKSLCRRDSQEASDGFGVVAVGNADEFINENY
jgi:CRISPR-associated protein Cmr3